MTRCCILGLGYIGLPTAAVLAHAGHQVIGVDVNSHVVSTVNQGRIHIVEPGLGKAVADAVATEFFDCTPQTINCGCLPDYCPYPFSR